ncbi:unnamed protein product [Gadus morhua 'NCC']
MATVTAEFSHRANVDGRNLSIRCTSSSLATWTTGRTGRTECVSLVAGKVEVGRHTTRSERPHGCLERQFAALQQRWIRLHRGCEDCYVSQHQLPT